MTIYSPRSNGLKWKGVGLGDSMPQEVLPYFFVKPEFFRNCDLAQKDVLSDILEELRLTIRAPRFRMTRQPADRFQPILTMASPSRRPLMVTNTRSNPPPITALPSGDKPWAHPEALPFITPRRAITTLMARDVPFGFRTSRTRMTAQRCRPGRYSSFS